MKVTKSIYNTLFSANADEQKTAITHTTDDTDSVSQDAPESAQVRAREDAPKPVQSVPTACLHPPGTDLNARGFENEIAILHWIEVFGWLITAQIARVVWGRPAVRMAQTTLARLLAQRELVKHALPNGIPAYYLTKRGARRLAEAGYDDPRPTNGTYKRQIETFNRHKHRANSDAASHRSPNSYNWQHRILCNWTCIYAREDGYGFFTEHQIEHGRAPFYEYAQKVPDVLLVVTEGDDRWLLWVEVEHSRRSALDRRRIAAWIRNMYPALWDSSLTGLGGWAVKGIVFVIPSNQRPLLTAIHNALMSSVTNRTQAETLLDIATSGALLYVRLGVTAKLGSPGFEGAFDDPRITGFSFCWILDTNKVECLRDSFPPGS